jgi:SAM-dependent methyltransferase
MSHPSFKQLVRPSLEPKFDYLEPPFRYNSADVRKFPPEISGGYLLNALCRRLGWPSLAGKRLLDYGCGVRFTRTILNLGMDIGLYAGVDVNKPAISWLQANVTDPRFRFEPLDVKNQMYNPEGPVASDKHLLTRMGFTDFDAACMFSVITHQNPDEAKLTFAMLRESVPSGGVLYFTAMLEPGLDGYREATPDKPGLHSAYNPEFLIEIVETTGWKVEATYERSQFEQPSFICR